MKRITALIAGLLLTAGLTACSSQSDTASYNLSKDAESFKIQRRIVFLNGITDKYLLVVEGRCSVDEEAGLPGKALAVTCKTGPGQFKKHYLGLSDNVTFFAEQLKAADVSAWHYKVIFRPSTIVPDVDHQSNQDVVK